jgi:arylsulfatase A-like enzyme
VAAAWALVFALDLLGTFFSVPAPADGLRIRAVRVAFDAGQYLAMAALSWVLLALAGRLLPRSLQLLAVAILGFALSALVLRHDLANAAEALVLFGRPGLGLWLALTLVGLAFPIVFWLGQRSGRRLRWLGLLAVVLVALGNAVLLPRNYPGLHLYVAVLASSAAALLLPPIRRLPLRREAWIASACALLAAPFFVVRPSAPALSDLLQSPGAVLAPFVANAQLALGSGGTAFRSNNPWYRDRSGLPALPATTPALSPEQPLVLLITLDALRADLLNREHLEALPAFQRFAEKAAVFTHARAPSPQTAASIAALFSGRLHSQLRWAQNPAIASPSKTFPHEDSRPRFPELLQKAGIATAMSAASSTLLNRYALVRGFGEEFEKVKTAEGHVELLIQRLDQKPAGALFWWSHFLDTHAPYKAGGGEGSLFERYRKAVAYASEQLEAIVAAVERNGLGARTFIIVTGDHGEAFGEHNSHYHATTLYDELLRVPLIIRGPKIRGQRIDVPVSVTDVGPTVLDLMHQPTPPSFLGQSLVPLLAGVTTAFERPIVAESGRGMRAMVFPDNFKLILDERNGTLELYDLTADPGELRNLYDRPEAQGKERLARLRAYFDAHEYRNAGYEKPFRP